MSPFGWFCIGGVTMLVGIVAVSYINNKWFKGPWLP